MGLSNVYGVPGLPGLFREARVLDGVAAASALKARVATAVERRIGDGQPTPVLATVAVGDDPASHADVANKHRACAEVGIDSAHRALGEGASQEEVAECVSSLNDDQSISGVLIQLPLPGHLDRQKLMDLVDPDKDVDGLTTVNMGRLCRRFGRPCAVRPQGRIGTPRSLRDRGRGKAGGRRWSIGTRGSSDRDIAVSTRCDGDAFVTPGPVS